MFRLPFILQDKIINHIGIGMDGQNGPTLNLQPSGRPTLFINSMLITSNPTAIRSRLMVANEAQIRAQSYYDHVQFYNQQAGNQAAWTTILSNLFHMDNPFPNEQLINEQCQVYYSKYQMENVAWTISLVLMSWVLRNFQRKIENGHCQNTAHSTTDPRNCEIGRQSIGKC